MTWSELTFTSSHVLTASDMNRLQGNFAALAGGSAGSPAIAVNSLTVTGVASLAAVEAVTVHLGGAPSGSPAANTLYKDNVPKAWIDFDGFSVANPVGLTGVRDYFNVSGVLDNATGDYTVYWDRDFANTSYAVMGSVSRVGANIPATIQTEGPLGVGQASIQCFRCGTGASVDLNYVNIVAFGDQ